MFSRCVDYVSVKMLAGVSVNGFLFWYMWNSVVESDVVFIHIHFYCWYWGVNKDGKVMSSQAERMAIIEMANGRLRSLLTIQAGLCCLTF